MAKYLPIELIGSHSHAKQSRENHYEQLETVFLVYPPGRATFHVEPRREPVMMPTRAECWEMAGLDENGYQED